MPVYDYTCMACEHTQEAIVPIRSRYIGPICEKCGHRMTFTLSVGPKPTDHLYPRLEYNFEANPVEIKSLRHFREEQKKRGLVDNGKPKGIPGQWL